MNCVIGRKAGEAWRIIAAIAFAKCVMGAPWNEGEHLTRIVLQLGGLAVAARIAEEGGERNRRQGRQTEARRGGGWDGKWEVGVVVVGTNRRGVTVAIIRTGRRKTTREKIETKHRGENREGRVKGEKKPRRLRPPPQAYKYVYHTDVHTMHVRAVHPHVYKLQVSTTYHSRRQNRKRIRYSTRTRT